LRLADPPRRGATFERAETGARLAPLLSHAAAPTALLRAAAEALRVGGELGRGVAVAEELITLDPRDPDSIVSATSIALSAGDPKRAELWARRLVGAGDAEDTRAGLELVCAIGAPLSAEDERFLDANPPRKMRSDEAYAASLDDHDRRDLIDDPGEQPLRDVLALLGEVVPLLLPAASAALLEAGIPDAARVPASSEAAVAALYPQIARLLGGPPTLLYTTSRLTADLTLLPAAPPVVVFGPKLVSMRASSHGDGHLATDAALRFQLGRIVELSRPHRVFAAMPAADFAAFVAGLGGERLRGKLPVAMRQRLAERLAAIAPDDLDPHAYLAACQRAADRAGLLACGDVAVAIELAGGALPATHLVHLAGSRRYLAVRKKIRAR
jgi:hypothetical protein